MSNPFAVSKHPSVLRSEARKRRKEREEKNPAQRIVEILSAYSEEQQNEILTAVLRKLR
jgi:hypothetical protein